MPRDRNVISRKPRQGIRSNWAGGQADLKDPREVKDVRKQLLNVVKPCFSSCPLYETCIVLQHRPPKIGDVCLDQAYSVRLFLTIFESIMKGVPTIDMKVQMAFVLACQFNVFLDLTESLEVEGVVVEEEVKDIVSGTIIKRIAPNPTLVPWTKLAEKLGITPESMLLTPKALADAKQAEDLQRTMSEILGVVTNYAEEALERIKTLPGGGNGKKEEVMAGGAAGQERRGDAASNLIRTYTDSTDST